LAFYYARYCTKIGETLSINFIDRREIIANDFTNQGQAAWFFSIGFSILAERDYETDSNSGDWHGEIQVWVTGGFGTVMPAVYNLK
jgi:hypothetical protein